MRFPPHVVLALLCMVAEPANGREAAGTGFIISPSGIIATAYHVISGSDRVSIRCGEEDVWTEAWLESFSAATDVALLNSKARTPRYLSLAPPRSVRLGEAVFTIGFPMVELLGSDPKFSSGEISALSGIGGDAVFMQTSVPVQPGNSGGPLVTDAGEVVGMIVSSAAIESFFQISGTLPQNVNWAVKSDYIRALLPSTSRSAAEVSASRR